LTNIQPLNKYDDRYKNDSLNNNSYNEVEQLKNENNELLKLVLSLKQDVQDLKNNHFKSTQDTSLNTNTSINNNDTINPNNTQTIQQETPTITSNELKGPKKNKEKEPIKKAIQDGNYGENLSNSQNI